MRLRLPVTVLAMTALALPASAAATTATQHFTAGQQLVDNLDKIAWPLQATVNTYDTGGTAGVTWGTDGSTAGWSNDTKCARLVRELFGHAYSWATDSWFEQEFGSFSPDTEELVAGMPTAEHFDEVTTVAGVQPGDVVMFDKAAADLVDHTAVVREVRTLSGGKTPQAGTIQYAVQVIDSTSNPHGLLISKTDPDYKDYVDLRRSEAGGVVTEYPGAGYGWMVLYASTSDGKVYGWRWGVNESAIWKVSDGHKVGFARATTEL